MKSIRVILYQKPLGIEIDAGDINEMKGYRPHFVCFPEYFFVDRELGNHRQTPGNQEKQMGRIKNISEAVSTVVIGGTMPEISGNRLFNTSFVYDRGELLGFYRKKNLFQAEIGTIEPGDTYKSFFASGIKFGVLICSDVFNKDSFTFMKNEKVMIIFSPTFSFKKNETVEEKFKRDRDIYQEGARLSGSIIVKVCGVKSEYKDFLQARSLIADSNGILYRVNPDEEDTSMIIKYEIIIP